MMISPLALALAAALSAPADEDTLRTLDTVVLTVSRDKSRDKSLEPKERHQVLVMHRPEAPKDKWAIPGGLVADNEDLPDTALRIVKRETGICLEIIAPEEEARLAMLGCHRLLEPGDGLNGGRARIAAGRADNGEALAAPFEERLEQPAKQLQRDILEGERRPVEQFEQPVLLVELQQRRNGGVAEIAIDRVAQRQQFILGQAARNEGRHDPRGEIGIGKAAHGANLGLTETRPLGWDIEAAIAGEAGQRHPFEIERRCAAACRDVLHGNAA